MKNFRSWLDINFKTAQLKMKISAIFKCVHSTLVFFNHLMALNTQIIKRNKYLL